MRNVARETGKNRAALFSATAAKMGVHPAIIEKDFWVCILLEYLFNRSPWKTRMVFKGGTSLFKAYGLIERFSEDIELILDWTLLGYAPEDPWTPGSATRQDKLNEEMDSRAVSFITRDFLPGLKKGLDTWLGVDFGISAEGQNVSIVYPKSFSSDSIRPIILLEMGPRARWTPSVARIIRPYAADFYPAQFSLSTTNVTTIVAERTFWEKATILHQEAHLGPEKRFPQRYSRHYYDLYIMSKSPVRDSAFSQVSLLNDVVEFKRRFYRCPWAHYEEALTGALRLLPPAYHLSELRKDYSSMRQMIFREIPDFDQILSSLEALEEQANTIIKTHYGTAL